MPARLGLDGSLNRRASGTYASPTWDVIGNVQDLSLVVDNAEAEVTARLNGGWRAFLASLRDATIEFTSVWDSADADLLAMLTAWMNRSVIDFACMDSAISVGNAGALGVRMDCQVYFGGRTETLAEGMTVPWKLRPTWSANIPKLVKVDSSGAIVDYT